MVPAGVSSTITSLPVDWVVIASVAVLLIVVSLRGGTRLASTLAVTLPIASFFFSLAPQAAFVGQYVPKDQASHVSAGLFGVLFVIFFALAYRLVGSFGITGARPVGAIIAGLAATASLIVFWLLTPGLEALWHFGREVQAVFGGAYRFWWLLLSFLALAFVRE